MSGTTDGIMIGFNLELLLLIFFIKSVMIDLTMTTMKYCMATSVATTNNQEIK